LYGVFKPESVGYFQKVIARMKEHRLRRGLFWALLLKSRLIIDDFKTSLLAHARNSTAPASARAALRRAGDRRGTMPVYVSGCSRTTARFPASCESRRPPDGLFSNGDRFLRKESHYVPSRLSFDESSRNTSTALPLFGPANVRSQLRPRAAWTSFRPPMPARHRHVTVSRFARYVIRKSLRGRRKPRSARESSRWPAFVRRTCDGSQSPPKTSPPPWDPAVASAGRGWRATPCRWRHHGFFHGRGLVEPPGNSPRLPAPNAGLFVVLALARGLLPAAARSLFSAGPCPKIRFPRNSGSSGMYMKIGFAG